MKRCLQWFFSCIYTMCIFFPWKPLLQHHECQLFWVSETLQPFASTLLLHVVVPLSRSPARPTPGRDALHVGFWVALTRVGSLEARILGELCGLAKEDWPNSLAPHVDVRTRRLGPLSWWAPVGPVRPGSVLGPRLWQKVQSPSIPCILACQ